VRADQEADPSLCDEDSSPSPVDVGLPSRLRARCGTTHSVAQLDLCARTAVPGFPRMQALWST